MRIGEMVALISYITQLVEIVPFIILVVGLYRMWKAKSISSRHNYSGNDN